MQNNFKTYDFSWTLKEILIESGTISHTLGKVVVKIRAQIITNVICSMGRFQSQQLVAPFKKGAQVFKEASYFLSYIKPGFGQH